MTQPDELLDGTQIPWDAISGPKPPTNPYVMPPSPFTPTRTPVTDEATAANLRVLQRALQTSSRWAGIFRRDNEQGNAA